MFDYPTIEGLSGRLLAMLRPEETQEPAASPAAAPAPALAAADVARLSDAEIEALLANREMNRT